MSRRRLAGGGACSSESRPAHTVAQSLGCLLLVGSAGPLQGWLASYRSPTAAATLITPIRLLSPHLPSRLLRGPGGPRAIGRIRGQPLNLITRLARTPDLSCAPRKNAVQGGVRRRRHGLPEGRRTRPAAAATDSPDRPPQGASTLSLGRLHERVSSFNSVSL